MAHDQFRAVDRRGGSRLDAEHPEGAHKRNLYSTIKRMIAEHAFRPGEPVIASELAVRLGVSHIPVREVLTRLAVEGRLEHKLHKGFWMRPHSVKELRDKYKLTYLLLAHSTKFDVGAFTMEGLEKPLDFEYDVQGVFINTNDDLINTHCRFIEQLFERMVSVGDNTEFDRIIRQFNDFTRPFRIMDLSDKEGFAVISTNILGLIGRLQEHDAEGAVVVLKQMLDFKVDRLPMLVDKAVALSLSLQAV